MNNGYQPVSGANKVWREGMYLANDGNAYPQGGTHADLPIQALPVLLYRAYRMRQALTCLDRIHRLAMVIPVNEGWTIVANTLGQIRVFAPNDLVDEDPY